MTNFIKAFIFNNTGIISIVEKNQYILHVDSKLKKPEIKKFCQEIFNIPVIYVNTLNIPPKRGNLKMKRAFVKFKGTKDTTNPFKNFIKNNSFSMYSSVIRKKNNNKKQHENLKIIPLDFETIYLQP